MTSFDPVTRQGQAINNLFGLELIISAVLFALVLGWLIIALVRFQARPTDLGEPAQVHGQRVLEITWTVIPALILAGVFVLMVQTMRSVETAQADAVRLRVIGHQWWWAFEYPDLGVVTANELYMPIGTDVVIELESADVIHSFYVPSFGMMRDTIPGKTNRMVMHIDTPGSYDGVCTQFCGLQHAWMRSLVVAVPGGQFAAWAAQQRQTVTPGSTRGQQVFLANTCVSCHAIRGLPATATVGPDLTHFGSRSTIGAGVLENTPVNLRRWLRNPQASKPGALMPAFGTLSDGDLNALADYLESLK